MNKRIYFALTFVLLTVASFAQSNFGEVKGRITDFKTKEGIHAAEIAIYQDGILKWSLHDKSLESRQLWPNRKI